jgi:aryl-alcohol dehydrogenase-like predicted oxidoreductase
MTKGEREARAEPASGSVRPSVERVGFGQTGLSVGRLGFGGMELAGPPRAPKLSSQESARLLHTALDLGINYFDTSIDYGQSEEIIGVALGKARDRVILASKCGCLVSGGGDGAAEQAKSHVYTAANIRAGVAQSLRRLRTDYIDVVQLHGNPTRREVEEGGAIEALLDLQQRGIIRYIGLSTRLPYVAEFFDIYCLSVFQLPYSAVQRQHEHVAARVAGQGRAVVARGVVGRGSAAKGWSARPVGMAHGEAKTVWEAARLDDLLGSMSRIGFMIRFALTSDAVHVCLVGTTDPAHLMDDAEAAAMGPLDPEVHAQALERLAAAGSAPGVGEYRSGGPSPRVTGRYP